MSAISQAYPDRVEVRGRDLTGDLMGRVGFTEYFHLLLTGTEPTEEQRYFLDLLLVSIAEHGLMPSNVAARMTLAADPESLQGAVAAGILGAGPLLLGTSEECARLLAAAVAAGRSPGEVARELHAAGARVPGFGHPVHRPLDPRAERILELADERGVSGPNVAFARELRDAVAETWGRPLPMNVSMPIAAVLLDLGFPVAAVEVGADPRQDGEPARAPRRGAGAAARVHPRPGRRGRRPLRARCSSLRSSHAPGPEQLAVDDASFRAQLAYLLERSAFYREKLAGLRHDGRARRDRGSCR